MSLVVNLSESLGFEGFVGRDRFTVIKPFISVHVRDVTSMEVVRFES